MKKLFVLLLATFCIESAVFAQTPQLLNYQGVARNGFGNALPNRLMTLRLSIRNGGSSGAIVYQETRTVTTNAGGLYSVQIGSTGTSSVMGSIATINWQVGTKFLQVEVDPEAGTNFLDLGTTQLVSVPYALSAGVANPAGAAGGDLSGTYPNPSVANGAINTIKLADVAVTTFKLADQSVTTSKLSDYSVTNNKLADGAVTTAKITDANVTTAKLADASVTDAKIVTVSGSKVTGNITGNAGTVTNGVYTVGDQTIAGVKTFSSTIVGSVSGNAATVTTNANLTGVVTSVGNATAIADGALSIGKTSGLQTALDAKENLSNKSTSTSLGTSDTYYPTQNAVKSYVDGQIVSNATPDATTLVKGKVQLAGDLTGTAALPEVAVGAITTAKLADGAVTTAKITDANVTTAKLADASVTDAKIVTVSGSKVTGNITGNAGTVTNGVYTVGDQTIAGVKTFSSTIVGSVSGNAATVTTNANLTGVVTSVGNATAIADGALSIGKTSGLQTALDAKENLSNKSTSTSLGTSDTYYPTQNAVKSYVDGQIVSNATPDATTLVKGKVQLAGDLTGTAALPEVAVGAITTAKLADASVTDAKIVTVSGSKVTGNITGNAGTVTNGVYTVGDQTIAGVKTFSSTIVGSVSGNAATVTTNANLTGVVTSVGNATAIADGALSIGKTSGLQTALDAKENLSNKSTSTSLGTSDTYYPTQNAVKSYVDGQIVSNATPDATTLVKGKVQLAGDLTGTAALPEVAVGAITTAKLADASVTDAKIVTVSGSKVTGNITGNAANVTGTVAVANGGTGATTAAAARTNLGLGNVDNTSDLNKPISTATQTALDLKENLSNKSTSTSLGTSDTYYPTQNAVKSYVDGQIVSNATPDATTLVKGKVQLAGDLTGTAALPEVAVGAITTAKLADGAVTTAKITDANVTTAKLADASVTDAKIVTVSGSKVTGNITGNAGTVTNGVYTVGDQTIAGVKTFSSTIVGSVSGNAATVTTNANLTGVVTSVGNATAIADGALSIGKTSGLQTALDAKENLSNKSTSTSLGTSDTYYPTQNAVKSYVDGQIVSNATPDATTLVKGKVQLAGDLTGTAALPEVAVGAITTAKLADASVTDAKIVTVSGSKVTGNITGNAANVTGTVAVANGGTGATTAAAARTNLGLGNVDNTSDLNKPISTATQTALDLKENLSNKSTSTSLGTSDTYYPTQNAVKSYVDGQIVSNATPDATTLVKGKVQLAGDLTGTAALPEVAVGAITTAKLADASVTDAKIVTVSGSKVTGNITGNAGTVTNGVYTVGDQTIAGVKTFSSTIVGSVSGNAATVTTNANLTGVVTSVGNATAIADGALSIGKTSGLQTALDAKENLSNKSTSTSLGTSDTYYPTQNAVKSYVDGQIVSNATPDATTLVKGKVQLAGDLTGTAALPEVAVGAITTAKLADASVTDAKIVTVSGSKVTGNITGNAANVTGTVAVANGGTGATTAAGARDNLGATTVGSNLFTLTNPSAVTFPRFNADNTVSALDAASFRTAIGAGTSSTSGTVTSIDLAAGTSGTDVNVSGGPITSSGTITLNIPDASATARGVITTGTQTVAGAKTFSSDLTVNGITVGKGLNSITYNTAIGTSALAANTTGSYNTANGYQSLYSNTTGVTNTANGYQSLYSNTTGEDNTAIGVNTIRTGSGATNGSRNTAVGRGALENGNSANDNTAIGAYTMNTSTTGQSNVALGSLSLYSSTSASYNVGVGFEALKNTTTGGSNTAIGHRAMLSNTTGDVNTAVGDGALISNISGRYNTSMGVQSQEQNTTGSQNTAIGVAAIDQNRSGDNNAVLGAFAGRHFGSNYAFLSDITTRIDNSVLIGYDARPLANNASNEIVIGYNAVGNGSNTVQLGNTSVTNVKTSGTITAGSITYPNTDGTANQVLTTNGSGTASWSTPTTAVTTVGTIAGSSTANGASISGATLTLAPADGTNGGIVTNGTQTFAGAKTFSAAPVLSTATASQALFTDANKNIVSNAITGTGNVVMSTSPTLTTPNLGTPSALTLTNATGLSLTSGVTGTLPIANGGTGATTAADARTNLGSTTVGSNLFTLTNPSAVTFPRFNADNTVSALDASSFRTAIGAGTSSTSGTVTSIALSTGTTGTDVNVSGSPITSSGTITLNIPNASATARGLVTTGAQTFAGVKTFDNIKTLSSQIGLGSGAGASNQAVNSVAIGNEAGSNDQEEHSIGIGTRAAYYDNAPYGISIGYEAGYLWQWQNAIAIGKLAGNQDQFPDAVAIGTNAGYRGQHENTVAIGNGAGKKFQWSNAIAIGKDAGAGVDVDLSASPVDENKGQQSNAIAIGTEAGNQIQGETAIAIGYAAGKINQGSNAVAIGTNAGYNGQISNSIAINASGSALNPANAGFYVNPIRSGSATGSSLNYDPTTKEITYSSSITAVTTVGAIAGSSTANGASISGATLTLAPADGTNGGVVTTGTQTFAGAKTFSSDLTVNGITVGKGLNSITYNTAVGTSALDANTTGDNNTGIGSNSLTFNTTGVQNTAVGSNALRSNTSGYNNTSIGFDALRSNTTGVYNAASGAYALGTNISGIANTAHGYAALRNNTTATGNTASGYYALYANTEGTYNTAAGFYSMNSNTTGSLNTAFGTQALHDNTSGYYNTALGFEAGRFTNAGAANQTSNESLYLGLETSASASGNTNEIVIGNWAQGNGSNSVTLGNSSITKSVLRGKVGIGTTSPSNMLDVSSSDATTLSITSTTSDNDGMLVLNANSNTTTWADNNHEFIYFQKQGTNIGSVKNVGSNAVTYNTSSDYRLKEDFQNFSGLSLVNKMKVYDYAWKSDKSRMYGFKAHELQTIVPYLVSGKKDEVDANGKPVYQMVDYSKLTPVLVKALQEQQDEIDSLKKRQADLEERLLRLEAKIK